MTIGELLKEYRINQAKKQKDFTDNGIIVSQSYYSKVEKNIHRITADSLIELLHYNNIPLWEFFSRLNQHDEIKHQEIKDFNNVLFEAYYENNRNKVKALRPLVKESNLSNKDKEEELLLIEAWLEVMKNTTDKPNKKLRYKVKEKIFNIPNLNENKVALFCNFMPFYDLESNKIIAKKIINQYILSSDIKMQVALLAIIVNVLATSLDEGKEKEKDVTFFINNAKKIKVRPELVFYKLALLFFENIIRYKTTRKKEFFDKSKEVVVILTSINMLKYGETLQKLLLKYK